MADANMILSGEVNLGQIGVIISILGTGFGIYLKSRMDLQRLSDRDKMVAADMLEVKADLKAMNQNQQDIKLSLAAMQATTSFPQMMAGLPDLLGKSIGEAIARHHRNNPPQ